MPSPYLIVAPPGIAASLLPGQANVKIQWSPYAAADAAGHRVVGYRIYRSASPSILGTLIADINVLGPTATSFDDTNEPLSNETVYYTLFAVEPTDFGSRPYGEGGNVTVMGV